MNPFICEDGGFPIQSNVSQVEQSLTLFQNALYCDPASDAKSVSFDFDDCCAFQYVLDGLRGALREVVDKLDDYELKEKTGNNISSI